MAFFKKLFGPKTEAEPEGPKEPVILNVYDLAAGGPDEPEDPRRKLPFGMGVYHSGVQVFGAGMCRPIFAIWPRFKSLT
jgi:hypothetical protein